MECNLAAEHWTAKVGPNGHAALARWQFIAGLPRQPCAPESLLPPSNINDFLGPAVRWVGRWLQVWLPEASGVPSQPDITSPKGLPTNSGGPGKPGPPAPAPAAAAPWLPEDPCAERDSRGGGGGGSGEADGAALVPTSVELADARLGADGVAAGIAELAAAGADMPGDGRHDSQGNPQAASGGGGGGGGCAEAMPGEAAAAAASESSDITRGSSDQAGGGAGSSRSGGEVSSHATAAPAGQQSPGRAGAEASPRSEPAAAPDVRVDGGSASPADGQFVSRAAAAALAVADQAGAAAGDWRKKRAHGGTPGAPGALGSVVSA